MKFLTFAFILIFSAIKPSSGKGLVHFNPRILNYSSVKKGVSNDRLIFGISYFNVFRQKNDAFEVRAEYRSSLDLLNLKPFAGITFSSKGAFYGLAGIYSDIEIGDIIFTPSFAAGYFDKGTGYDLAYELEFRTQLEFSYLLQNNTRIGLAFYHISNGNLGKSNPGAESFSFIYSLPIN